MRQCPVEDVEVVPNRYIGVKVMKPRVAMVAPFGMMRFGSVRLRMLPLAKALRSYNITIIIPPLFEPEDSGKSYRDGEVNIINISIPRIPFLRIPIITYRLIRKVMSLKPDIIHVFKPKGVSGLVAMFFLLFTNKKVILDTDDWEGKGGWNDVLDYPWILKKFISFQEVWISRHVYAVTVASNALLEQTLNLVVDKNRIYYVPNGIDATLTFREGNGKKVRDKYNIGDLPVILLYTRFFEFGVERIIQILKAILVKKEVRLLVVGKGRFNEEERLLNLAERERIADKIIYAGWLRVKEIPDYMAASAVAIYPYDDTLLNRSKCSVKLIELMAYGKAIVADAVGQNKEYIIHGESGLLANPGNSAEFVSLVLKTITDKTLRDRLGINARNRVFNQFNWDLLSTEVVRCYRSLH